MADSTSVAGTTALERPRDRVAKVRATSAKGAFGFASSQSARSAAARRRRDGSRPDTGSSAGMPASAAAAGSIGAAASSRGAGAGGDVRTTWALVPPKPKPETPATLRPEYSGHSRGSSTTSRRPPSKSMYGFGPA